MVCDNTARHNSNNFVLKICFEEKKKQQNKTLIGTYRTRISTLPGKSQEKH